ncbi:hypothetical protein F2Q70_00012661 [Brassica cretica]|uniref:Uncharacterized protein n=1 Tax=Brassica cretica TaxID=69181 RepID=A0A8S9LRP5_BRACR|nr:hypothetical protein F2Q70_00012661 [Brassica cretica]
MKPGVSLQKRNEGRLFHFVRWRLGAVYVSSHDLKRRRYTLNRKEEESVVNDHFEQPKDELVMERDVIHEQQEQAYTQVQGGKSKRDYLQQYVPRGSLQNQRGHRGARRGYSNARGGRAGDGGYSNGRYESYDNSGGNSYQRSYYNSRGRGRGGGNSYSYNNHRDSNVTVASSLLCLWLLNNKAKATEILAKELKVLADVLSHETIVYTYIHMVKTKGFSLDLCGLIQADVLSYKTIVYTYIHMVKTKGFSLDLCGCSLVKEAGSLVIEVNGNIFGCLRHGFKI